MQKKYSVTGYWKIRRNEQSRFHGEWTWNFDDTGRVTIEEILGAEARLPMSYEGTYTLDGNMVRILINPAFRFPDSFTVSGNELVSAEGILARAGF